MIKISSALRENINMPKPGSLALLIEKVCMVYEIKELQLVLTYENDNEDKELLQSEVEYSTILSSDRDFDMTAYIQPQSKRPKFVAMSLGSLFLTYLLMKFATVKSVSVSISDNSGYILYLFLDIFYIGRFILSFLLKGSYWIPLFGSFLHYLFLLKYWAMRYISTRSISRNKIIYKLILTCNFVPNFIGYISSMIVIGWFVLVYFHVVLHREKPRSEKDKSFMKVISVMVIASIPRLLYYY